MAEDKMDTRSRILEAAAEIIGKERNLNLTIREIAGRANVNIASINYHFRSKENLLDEVELLLMEKIRLIYTGLNNTGMDTRGKLIDWADSLIKHLIDYPGIIYLLGTRVLEREGTSINQYLSLLETDLTPLVRELTGVEDQTAIGFKVLHLISGVVYPVLILSGTDQSAGININNRATRKKYVTSLVASIEMG
jgi:TetR/AcrR family transcriptional regulator, regulator of cefoperazone and chloramphenicol sensitivity